MEKISTFMYAENSMQVPTQNPNQNSTTELKLQIVSPLLIISPIFVPGTFSFSIIAGILGVDLSKAHKMDIIFSNNETKEELAVYRDVQLGPVPQNNASGLPVDLQGLTFSANLQNVKFENDGIYNTAIYLDGKKLGDFPIPVRQKTKQEA